MPFKQILAIGLLLCGGADAARTQDYAAELARTRETVNRSLLWQLDHMPTRGRGAENPPLNGWADGVFLSAVADWDEYDPSAGLRARYTAIAEQTGWEPGRRSLNPANDVSVSLAYAKIYQLDPQPRYILTDLTGVPWIPETWDKLRGGWKTLIPTIERLDFQMKDYPRNRDYDPHKAINQEKWSWCDALYMAAPTYALYAELTGDKRYRRFMNREYWRLIGHLYDPDERLVFRDASYLDKREPNGEKMFWGRGNGWVAASLARVIDYLPVDYGPRRRYIRLFGEMMPRIAELQGPDGYWGASLLDRESYPAPETSATGFFTYALWWGINNGLLDKKTYLPAARAGWEAMVRAVQPSGMLGYVQPIGDRPENISADKNEVYGTAALALAGLEVCRYLERAARPPKMIRP